MNTLAQRKPPDAAYLTTEQAVEELRGRGIMRSSRELVEYLEEFGGIRWDGGPNEHKRSELLEHFEVWTQGGDVE
jgi:hypothetical protein